MPGTTTIAGLALLAAGLTAQDMVLVPLRCGDVFTRVSELSEASGDAKAVVVRLQEMLPRLAATEGRKSGENSVLQFLNARAEPLLVMRDTEENVAVLRGVITRLQAEDPSEPTTLRVQCTVLHVSLKVAEAHGLAPERVVPAKRDAVTPLLRVAVEQKGVLHNLPDVRTFLLAPFTAELPPRPPAKSRDVPDRVTRPVVRGTVVGLRDDDYAVDVRLYPGTSRPRPAGGDDGGKDRDRDRDGDGDGADSARPPKPVLHRALRLKIDSGALVCGKADAEGRMPVLWVRLAAGN